MGSSEEQTRQTLHRTVFASLVLLVALGLSAAHGVWTDQKAMALFFIYAMICFVPAAFWIGVRLATNATTGAPQNNMQRDIVTPVASSLVALLIVFVALHLIYN